jgi:exopolysaccharide production protein ExoQ
LQQGSHHWLISGDPVAARGYGSRRQGAVHLRRWLATVGGISLTEIAIVLVLVFFGVAGAIPGIAPNQASAMTGIPSSPMQAMAGIGTQLLVDLFVCVLLLRHARLLRRRIALLWSPLALGIWSCASVAWSVDPLLTARRAIPFLLAAGFGALLALRLPPRRILFLLVAAFVVLALWSAVLAVGFPSIGLDASTGHSGDWQGAFTQKNACGRIMVIALAAWFGLIFGAARWQSLRPWQGVVLLLFATELVLSGSRGAWLIAFTVFCALASIQMTRGMRPKVRTAAMAFACGLVLALLCWAATHFAQLAPLLGRDTTLSGRTEIWQQVWIAILQRPWFGYGFSAFWQGFSGPSWNVIVALHFVLFHAHNGFLEIWLELGAFGLVIFSVTFLRAAVLLWPKLRSGRFASAAWPLAILLLTVLYNCDENTLLSFNGLFWVLYCSVLVQIEMFAAERRKRFHRTYFRRTQTKFRSVPSKLLSAELHSHLSVARNLDEDRGEASAIPSTAHVLNGCLDSSPDSSWV